MGVTRALYVLSCRRVESSSVDAYSRYGMVVHSRSSVYSSDASSPSASDQYVGLFSGIRREQDDLVLVVVVFEMHPLGPVTRLVCPECRGADRGEPVSPSVMRDREAELGLHDGETGEQANRCEREEDWPQSNPLIVGEKEGTY